MWVQGQPWRCVDCIDVALFPQLKAAAPQAAPPATPASSWGTIADDAHNSSSDHYPHYYSVLGTTAVVCAGDWPHAPSKGLDNNIVCEALRLSRDPRIKYVIWNRRMFSSYASSGYPAWTWRPYTGSNDPHDTHAHMSVVAAAIADSTAPWSIGIGNGEPEMDDAHAALLRAIAEDWSPNQAEWTSAGGSAATWTAMANAGMVGTNGRINKDGANVKALVSTVDGLVEDVAELKEDIATLAAGGVTHEALVAALTDPAVVLAMTQAATVGAEAAEDS